MSFKKRFQQNLDQDKPAPPPVRDWWSAAGTGWGPNHDQANPIARLAERVKRDATESVYDLKDEPEELAFRLKDRLRSYADITKGRRNP